MRGAEVSTHVTSRPFELPDSATEMSHEIWFQLWQKRLWPYNELRPGDELYWYESPSKRIVWRTSIVQVEAFAYADRNDALLHLNELFDAEIDLTQPYLNGKPMEGYCLGYKVSADERVDIPKPEWIAKFNQMGWEHGDRPEISRWLSNGSER